MLLAWSLIYKHNFSPHSFFIYGTIIIYSIKTSLYFFQNWYNNKIILVRDLLMKVVFFCHIMSFYRSLTFLFHPKNLQLSLMLFLQESLHCLKVLTELTVPPLCDPFQTTVGKTCLIPHSSNKLIRALYCLLE